MERILVAIHELSYTGAVFSAKRICCILLNNGYDVSVWSVQNGPFIQEFDHIGIKLQIINPIDDQLDVALIEDLKKYDLLIANTINTYFIADVAKNIIPTIWYIREARNLPWEFFHFDIKKYYALKRAEKMYVVSKYASDYLEKTFHVHTQIIHNAVEDESEVCERTDSKNRKIKFLTLGTIVKRKNFDIFLEAYNCLSQEEKEQCEMHFAGKQAEGQKEYCARLMNMAKNDSGIIYHGEIQERNRLLQLIADSDVIVVPSKDESCSLVVLEGAMMSKPLIVSENVGAKYMVTANNGWIVETDSVEALRNVYREVIIKRDRLKEMGEYSRRMYLETSTYDIYEKNILKMVSDNLFPDKQRYQEEHRGKMEDEEQQRFVESKMKSIHYFVEPAHMQESKIVIYAAGMVGQAFYQWCKMKKYEVVAWVDRNWQDIKRQREDGIAIEAVEKLKENIFDLICIAVNRKEMADEIKETLVGLGIEHSKIIWVEPIRYEF